MDGGVKSFPDGWERRQVLGDAFFLAMDGKKRNCRFYGKEN